MELTVVSYNIHSGIGADGRFDLRRTRAVLEEIHPDIAALQEVGDFRGRTATDAHPEHLALALGLHMAYGANVVRNGRRYGNAILTRLQILKSKNYDLTFRHREPRGALRCDLDLGGKTLHVFCLHLGLGIGERRAQESLLLSSDILRDAVRSDPLVLCGDFNYWGGGAVPSLVRHAIDDAALILGTPKKTFHAKLPFFRFDRIFVDRGVRPSWIRPHLSELSRVASDHLPLVMRCEAPIALEVPQASPVEIMR